MADAQPNFQIEVSHGSTTIPQLLLEILCICVKCIWLIAVEIYYLVVPRTLSSVKGDIVLVTGAGHGIGKALALKYASEGATVVCWDINPKSNEETVREIADKGYPKAYSYVCDVTSPSDVSETSKKVQKEVGNVTILINNAGVGGVRKLLDWNVDQIEQLLKVNIMAHFLTIKAFLPQMMRHNCGHIVAISSLAGLVGGRNGTPYCASKFAVRGMMEALYQELKVDPVCKIRLTTIYPAGVDTGIFKKAVVRFPKFFPVITPEEAASLISKAQRQNLLELSIPRTSLMLNAVLRLFPISVQDVLLNFINTHIVE